VFQEAGAKVEILFQSRKLFVKFFLKKFSSLFFFPACQSLNELPLSRGCKGKSFFYLRQAFHKKKFNLFLSF
jgi:hypothetical protein